MSGVAIYMEGGGNKGNGRAVLRQGMDAFLDPLKQAARDKSTRWKLVCCGSRDEAYRAFQNALRNGDDGIVVLLVDAEGPVEAQPRAHLHARDGWDLTDIDGQSVYLMVQTMEAWIVADALRSYYGQRFNQGALPRTDDLERVGKPTLENSLQRATERTQKGRYKKIAHASDLLKRIDAEQVKARCRHCGRLFDELGGMIDAA